MSATGTDVFVTILVDALTLEPLLRERDVPVILAPFGQKTDVFVHLSGTQRFP